MYILNLEYMINGEAKSSIQSVNEMYASVASYGHSCRFTFAEDAQGDVYEDIIANEGVITNLVLSDKDGNELYNSHFWDKVASVQNNFQADGNIIREVNLVHSASAQ